MCLSEELWTDWEVIYVECSVQDMTLPHKKMKLEFSGHFLELQNEKF